MSIRRSLALTVVLALALAACSDAAETTSSDPTGPTAEPSPSVEAPSQDTGGRYGNEGSTQAPSGGRETQIESDDSALGLILTDGRGNTLYLFMPDAQGASTCYGDCEANWPPLLAKGELEVSGNDEDPTDASLLGTAEREDGGLQVTYNGWPLYFFAGDQGPGDTNRQGVGDVWFVVSPEGEPITG